MALPIFQELYELYKETWFPSAKLTPIQQFYDMHKNHYVSAKKPRNILKCAVKLAEETGEVAEAVSAFVGNEKKTKKLAVGNSTPEEGLSEELADVIIVALNIAHAAKLDVDQMFLTATAKMRTRTDKRIKQEIEQAEKQKREWAEKQRGIPPTAEINNDKPTDET